MPQLQELLLEEIRDIYDAEKQAVKAYPKLAKSTSSTELREAVLQHLEETKGQVARIEQIFEMMGQRAKSKPCKAMKGLIEEAMEHVSEHDKGHELDTVLIGSAQKMEHYEIAAYGTARAMAKSTKQKEIADLLDQTLKEEGNTDKRLTQIALGIQKTMLQEEGESTEGVEESARSGRSASGGGVKKKAAGSKQAGGKRSASGSASTRNGASSRKLSPNNQTSVTTDHDEIRTWAEARGAHPACVRGTGGKGDTGMIRLDFPGYSGADSLEEITWDEFFQKFDESNLALLYRETAANGQKSNFNKLVARETAELASQGGRGSARRGTGRMPARGR